MENTIELPPDMQNVMITYKKTIRFGAYGINTRIETVTERGFYSKMFNNVSIPHEWRHFKGILLPHGFNSTRLSTDKIIKWEPIAEHNINKQISEWTTN